MYVIFMTHSSRHFADQYSKSGIVVSCASAFRQLFLGSNSSNSKPVWTATDSFYDRMISSFQSKDKRANDANLYNIPDASQTGQAFGYVSMRNESEAASQQSSQSPVVFPSLSMPVADGYEAPGQNYSQITKKVEYRAAQH